jgi:RNA polymerase sigma-70 factor (ECF subfamily)
LLATDLISKCLKGNKKAQLKLYNSYCDAMLTIAFRYVRQRDLAEDITQEAFIKAFSNLDTIDGRCTFGAWLKQIVIYQSIDCLRKKNFDLSLDYDHILLPEEEEKSWIVEDSISVELIKSIVENLPLKYSLVLKLFLMEGYDHQEISEILKISVNASRTQLHRGKTMLKNELIKQGYERFA